MAGEFNWAAFMPLMRVMWRDRAARARGAAALDRAWADRGTEIATAIDLLERAAAYDEDAIAEIAAVRNAAMAGNLAQQRYLTLLRYANEARKTQAKAQTTAPVATVETDPYHRMA